MTRTSNPRVHLQRLTPTTLFLLLQTVCLLSIRLSLEQTIQTAFAGALLWSGLYFGWLTLAAVCGTSTGSYKAGRLPAIFASYLWIIAGPCLVVLGACESVLTTRPGALVFLGLGFLSAVFLLVQGAKSLSVLSGDESSKRVGGFFLCLWLLACPIPIGPYIVQRYVHRNYLRRGESRVRTASRVGLAVRITCVALCLLLAASIVSHAIEMRRVVSEHRRSYGSAAEALRKAGFDPRTLRPDTPLTSRTLYLSLRGAAVADLGKLPDLPISTLVLRDIAASDLSPVTNLPLRDLDIIRAPIKDIGALARTRLESLALEECPISDLSPLRQLPLSTLNVRGTMVTDLESIENLPLTFLNIRDTGVTDVSALKNMPLKSLTFDWEKISAGLDFIRDMETLEWVSPEDDLMLTREDYLAWEKGKRQKRQ